MERLNLIVYDSFFKEYHKTEIKKILYSLILFFSVFLISFFSLNTGDIKINIYDIFKGNLNENANYIFYNIRLLRVLSAFFAGGALGVSGAILQIILRNPMASPYTLGISQGAAFGASAVIIFGGAGVMTSYGEGVILKGYSVVFGAFAGSLISLLIVFLIGYFKRFSRTTLILSGIAVGSLFQSATMFIQYFADEIKASATLFWTFGDVSKGTYFMVWLLLFLTSLVVVYFSFKGWHLNAMSFGRDFAKTLGVKVSLITSMAVSLVSVTVSVTVSFLGIIGFVGLIAPHISRFISLNDNRFNIINSFLVGSLILILSDILSRRIFYPSVIPVGIITSFFGVIVLIYLIIGKSHD